MRTLESHRSLPLLLLLLAIATPASAQEVMVRIAERLRERLEVQRERVGSPGASLAVVLPDGVPVTVAVGFADPDTKRRMSPRDRMMAGGCGKTFVAAAAMRLVLEGKLSLDEPISKWLGEREWFWRLPNASDLTLRHLLRHRSGIRNHYWRDEFGYRLEREPKRTWKPEELIAFVLDDEPLAPAGEEWSYAHTNFLIAGLVLEEVAGEPFYEQVRTHFLEPHGLQDTIPSDRCDLPGVAQGVVGVGHRFGFPNRTQQNGEFAVNPQFEWCGGGFATTPRDLARWAWLLYSGQALEGEYLGELLDDLPTGRFDKGGVEWERYGLGTFLRDLSMGEDPSSAMLYGHEGSFPGYFTSMGYFPEFGIAAAIQFNTDDVGEMSFWMPFQITHFVGIAVEELERTWPLDDWEICRPFSAENSGLAILPGFGLIPALRWHRIECGADGWVDVDGTGEELERILARTVVWSPGQPGVELELEFSGRIEVIHNGLSSFSCDGAEVGPRVVHLDFERGLNEIVLVLHMTSEAGGFAARIDRAVEAPVVDHARTELLWETPPIFLTPESVLHDRERNVLYVTSSDRARASKPGPSGFISKLDLLGEVLEREWITGLQCPCGMALHGGRLYVAERGHLTVIDVDAGEFIERHPIPTSILLSDVACDGRGNVYVSDSFAGGADQGASIYRLTEGHVEPWLDDPSFGGVNGLCVHGDELLVGNSADGTLRAIELATQKSRIIASTGTGIVIGIRVDDTGDYLVSHWEGPTFRISPRGEIVEILDPSPQGWNVADFELVVEEGMLIVPTFYGNRVVCYTLVER